MEKSKGFKRYGWVAGVAFLLGVGAGGAMTVGSPEGPKPLYMDVFRSDWVVNCVSNQTRAGYPSEPDSLKSCTASALSIIPVLDGVPLGSDLLATNRAKWVVNCIQRQTRNGYPSEKAALDNCTDSALTLMPVAKPARATLTLSANLPVSKASKSQTPPPVEK